MMFMSVLQTKYLLFKWDIWSDLTFAYQNLSDSGHQDDGSMVARNEEQSQ